MKLIVDIGNSDIVLGIYQNKKWQYTWRIASDLKQIKIDFKSELLQVLDKYKIDTKAIQQVVLSSVVPDLTTVVSDALEALFVERVLVVNAEIYPALNIKIVRNEDEIGTDLVANAVAGYDYAKGACIIVDFGTALTFTVIAEDGTIEGVTIAPGLKTAMSSLASNAAQLPEIPLELPQSVIGTNTVQAMQAGILWGYVGLVNGLLTLIKMEMEVSSCKIIATGGMSNILLPLKDYFDKIDKNLTLNGLRLIGDMHKK